MSRAAARLVCLLVAVTIRSARAVQPSLLPAQGPLSLEKLDAFDALTKLEEENGALKKRIAELEQRVAHTGPHPTHHGPAATTILDRKRMEKVAGPEKRIILTFVNTVRLDFAATWVAHVRRLGLTNWLVGATDEGALKALLADETPTFDMHTSLPTGEWAWGSPQFKALGPVKVRLIHQALQWGMELVITDIDALVLREPFAYMARWPDAGFLTTSDHLSNSTDDDGLEQHASIGSAFNIGYMFFRPLALPLVTEWLEYLKSDPKNRWDQGEFNRIARTGWVVTEKKGLTIDGVDGVPPPLSDPRLFRAYHGRVIGGVLPLALFCGGHNYFVAQMPQRRGVVPYSVHTTFQYGGAEGKRHRLREATMWDDEPSYYDPPGGMLRYVPDVPARLIHPPGGMSAQAHIDLVEHQLGQLGAALALSIALGRVLILPPIVCGYDKAWFGTLSRTFARRL